MLGVCYLLFVLCYLLLAVREELAVNGYLGCVGRYLRFAKCTLLPVNYY